MQIRFNLIALLLITSLKSFSQNDYKIQINDTVLEISLDKEYNLKLGKESVKFKVMSKDTLEYQNELFSFKYTKDYKISKMTLEDGIEQIMLMNAEGSGILIQQYLTINPTMLNEMMLSEITKESLNYGYQLQREDYSRDLKSGQKINIDKAILTYKDETSIYEVASIGKKDEGILVMTMITDNNFNSEGKKIIEFMWNTLEFK